MKNFLFIFTLAVLTSSAFAQDYISTIKYNTGLPLEETEQFISNYSWKGFEIGSRKFINRNATVGFMVGWNIFDEKESGTWTEEELTVTGTQLRFLNVFPLMLNAHYYLGRKRGMRLYLGANAGTYYIEQKTNLGIFSRVSTNWHFGLAPEMGFIIPLGGGSSFDIGARYNYALPAGGSITYSYLGVNVGFIFGH